MQKQIIKIEFNNKIICQKKLDVNSTLVSIRQLISNKIGNFSFIDKDGNTLDNNDENDFILSEILYGNIVKVKGQDTNNSGIIIFLNNNNFCSVNIGENETLSQLRNILINKVGDDFEFIDTDGNSLDKDDEKDFNIENILKDNIIYIKSLMKEIPNTLVSNISNGISKKINNNNLPKKVTHTSDEKKSILPRINFDLSKHIKLKEDEEITYYLYSEKQPQSNHTLVKQYYFDEFENVNNDKDAKIILFV